MKFYKKYFTAEVQKYKLEEFDDSFIWALFDCPNVRDN